MSEFLEKIAGDLFHDDERIRRLALNTVCLLTTKEVPDRNELSILSEPLGRVARSHVKDLRFLARKALNHLKDLELTLEAGVTHVPGHPDDSLTPAAPPGPEPVGTFRPSGAVSPGGQRQAESLPSREELLSKLRSCDTPETIATIVSDLSLCAEPSDVDTLAPFLSHPDSRVRANVVEFVARHGDEGRQVELLEPLLSDDDNRVRANAAVALGRLSHPSVRSYLERWMSDDQVSVRESAVFALSRLSGDFALNLLIAALDDEYEQIRLRAARALGHRSDPRAVRALRIALADEDPDVARAAGDSIRMLTESSGETPPAAEGTCSPSGTSLPEQGMDTGPDTDAAGGIDEALLDTAIPCEFTPRQSAETGAASTDGVTDFDSQGPESDGSERDAGTHLQPDGDDEFPAGTSGSLEDGDHGPVDQSTDDEATAPPPARSAGGTGLEGGDPPGSDQPAVSKKSILANLGNAAEALLGPSRPRLAEVRAKMEGLDRDGLEALLNHELGKISDEVFKLVRTGTLGHGDLNKPYYDILKYADFLDRQKERYEEMRSKSEKAGFFASLGRKFGLVAEEEDSARQAIERLEEKLHSSRMDLARQALDLASNGEIDFDGAAEMVDAIKLIEEALAG